MPTRIIVNTEGFAKIKMVNMLVTAKGQDIQETIVMSMSMNVMLKVHAKTMVPAQMKRGLFPVIAETLHIKENIATNLNTVSMVLPDWNS